MAGEYASERLGSVAAVQGGFAFKSRDFTDTGVPVLKIKNIRVGIVDTEDVQHVSLEVAEAASRFYCKHGDVLISMTGSGPQAPNSVVGRVARFTGEDDAYLINQRVGRFSIKNPRVLDARFLFYVLGQQHIQWGLVATATGSANQANISSKQIEAVEVPLPPIQIQQAIACILGALDDKIELNMQRACTMNDVMQAMFHDWFVACNPVRHKAAGQLPPSMGPHLASLFPESFTETPDGQVPTGWSIRSLGDGHMCRLVSPGVTHAASDRVQYIATGDVQMDSILGGTRDEYAALPSRANMSPGHDRIWFAKMKDSPKYLWTMREHASFWASRILSTGFAGLEAVEKTYSPLLYCFIASPVFEDIKNRLATGTTMQALNNHTVSKLPIVVPSRAVVEAFEKLVRPICLSRWQRAFENTTLAELRDTLLPRLMSGELEVSDAERIVGRAI